jgi:hypothetical protein
MKINALIVLMVVLILQIQIQQALNLQIAIIMIAMMDALKIIGVVKEIVILVLEEVKGLELFLQLIQLGMLIVLLLTKYQFKDLFYKSQWH